MNIDLKVIRHNECFSAQNFQNSKSKPAEYRLNKYRTSGNRPVVLRHTHIHTEYLTNESSANAIKERIYYMWMVNSIMIGDFICIFGKTEKWRMCFGRLFFPLFLIQITVFFCSRLFFIASYLFVIVSGCCNNSDWKKNINIRFHDTA